MLLEEAERPPLIEVKEYMNLKMKSPRLKEKKLKVS
jgi:hypothetical protein